LSYLIDALKKKKGLRAYIGPKRILILVMLIGFVILSWRSYSEGYIDLDAIRQYQISHPLLSISLFVVIYALSIVGALPTLPLNLAAGFFWAQ
jgi:uncharacterized membrane protein YdjX (TVP38/TMEM64 family)